MAISVNRLRQGINRALHLCSDIGTRWSACSANKYQAVSRDCDNVTTDEKIGQFGEPTVAIVGQPNVGKSALFNALVGGRRALVYNTPERGEHVTRDIRFESIMLRGGSQLEAQATVCDTPGLEMETVGKILQKLKHCENLADNDQVMQSMQEAVYLQERAAWKVIDLLRTCDLIVMVVDARKGIGPGDEDVAHLLEICKAKGVPVVLANNKSEREIDRLAAESDAFKLVGVEAVFSLSADSKIGVLDMQLFITQRLLTGWRRPTQGSSHHPSNVREDVKRPGQSMHFAFVGLPNVGKSSLLNAIVDEERALTGPEKGLTRDAIGVKWNYKGKIIEMIDTAGWKQPQKIHNRVEQLAHANTQRVLESRANTVGLVLDPVAKANMGELFRLRFGNLLSKGDIKLLSWLVRHQKAVMVLVNKMDLVPKEIQESIVKRLREQISYTIPEVSGLPILAVSAKSKKGVSDILTEASKLYYDRWSIHINTARLNQWLAKTTARIGHGPSAVVNRVRFICQTGISPPIFTIDIRGKELFKRHERRFIENAIRNDFQLNGVPVKVVMRPRTNPFVDDSA